MKSIVLILFFLAIPVISTYSQNTQDSIIVKEHLFGNSYYQKGTEIKKDQVYEILSTNPESQSLLETSFTQKSFGIGISIGGLLVTGSALASMSVNINNYGHVSDRDIILGAAGVGLCIAGILFIAEGNMNFRKAVKKFNKSALHSENGYFDSGIKPYFSYKGIGISYQF